MGHEIRPHITEHQSTLIPAAVKRNSVQAENSQKSCFSSAAAGYINVQLNSHPAVPVNLQQEKPGKHPQCHLIMQKAGRVGRKYGSRLVFL